MTQATAYYNQPYHDYQYDAIPPNAIQLLLAQCNPATKIPFAQWRNLTREAYLLYDTHQISRQRKPPPAAPSPFYHNTEFPLEMTSGSAIFNRNQ
jgi:hypothetical protein